VGNQNYSATVTAGTNFNNDRGNVTVFAGTDQIEQTFSDDLRQFRNFGTIGNPDNTGENDGILDRLTVPYVGSEFISTTTVINPFAGLFFGETRPRVTFLPDGTPIDQVDRIGSNSFAFGSFANDCDTCYFPEGDQDILPKVDKKYLGFQTNYDITDSLNAYASGKYVQSDIDQNFQASFSFGGININLVDNPYIDETLRQRLLAGDPANGIAPQTTALAARFFSDIGFRAAENDRELTQYALGLRGDFDLSASNFNYDVSFVEGQSKNARITTNDLIPGNLAAAIDAVVDPVSGEIICRGGANGNPGTVTPSECAPFNPFGFAQFSQASADFITAPNLRNDDIKQQVLLATLASDTSAFFSLPGGAIDYVVGFEYRDEQSETTTDELSQSGNLNTAATPDTGGNFEVEELFAELNLPILADRRFAQDLTLGLAYRTADYTHAGKTDAWKVDLQWSPIDSVTLRGTLGEAVRAPNIDEAFGARSPGFANIADPCDVDNINNDPDRVANCAALGIPVGFEANDNVSVDTISGGNPNLKPEQSESATGGIVWRPNGVLDGLNLSVDYYDIEINDAILFVAAQTIVNNCVNSSQGLDRNFCDAVTRDPVTNDVTLIESGEINGSSFTTSGFDVNVGYGNIDIGAGSLDLNLFVNVLKELDFFEFQNIPEEIDPEVGQLANPEMQARFTARYSVDDLTFNWATRVINRATRLDLDGQGDVIPEDLQFDKVGTIATHDFSMNYEINDNYRVFGGIRNLGDKVPPGYVDNSIYDVIGRRAFIGFNASF